MRAIICLLAITIASGPSAFAQQPPGPAPELAKYDRLIGNWSGSGNSVMAPGTPAAPWTATSSIQKVLGGHFLREDVIVDLGEDAPFSLMFRTLYGYDRERQRYMSISAGNMGPPMASEIHWADDNTMITAEVSIEEGQVMSDRWVTSIGKDAIEFACHRVIGNGRPFIHVQGRMVRSNSDKPVELDTGAPSVVPIPEQMVRLGRIAGSYRMTGTYQAMPDAPELEIGGDQTFTAIFGGLILEGTVAGDEMPGFGSYQAWAAYGWHPAKNHHVVIYANNMGEIGAYEGSWVGNELVMTVARPYMGVPSASRSVMSLDDKGGLKRSVGYSLMGSSAPMKMFEGNFVRK